LSYDDEKRQRYLKEQGVNFPVVHWTKESDAAYGGISIFPTLFLIDRKGTIIHHWVGFVPIEDLRSVISEGLGARVSATKGHLETARCTKEPRCC